MCFLAFQAIVFGQQKITLNDIYGADTFYERSVGGINWMNNGQYYSAKSGNDIVKYDITTGSVVETLLEGEKLGRDFRFQAYRFSADEQQVLLMTERESIYRRSYRANYYVYDLGQKKLRALSSKGKQSYATFSPNGEKIAFVRGNNLFYTSLMTGEEKQVTRDGKFNHIINGSADWVYEEEYSFAKAFFWSPDGKKIAFYRFDETGVNEYNMQKWNKGQLYPEDYRFKYPKAGEGNSKVSIHIHDLESNSTLTAKLEKDNDFYIPRVQWTATANLLSIRKMNRLQNELQLFHVNATTGEAELILKEKSDTYVDIDFCDDLTYLEDQKHFVHSSESDGYKHLYLYTMEGKTVRQLTKGKWDVDTFLGIKEGKGKQTLYYTSTEGSPMERYFFSIGINGKGKKKLSQRRGYHRVNMSNDYKYYIEYFSNATTPKQVNLYRTKGNTLIKNLEDNAELKQVISAHGVQSKSFFTFNTVDGTALNGYMIKPKDMEPGKKYPLLLYQYSGPGSQQVKNEWAGSHFFWHQMLAQKGYIVAVVDTRGTGGRGARFKKMTYKQLGKLEAEDHIAGAKYLAGLTEVDADRIGIWGWSYGGYISSLCMMKGADVFKAGIAVAPVTNWRFYDTIYTERYLQRPQDNASGYDDNSPTQYAHLLKGNFFLIHGTGDDNVHVQNSMALVDALISANKQFDTFFYPDRTHGIGGGNTRLHLFTMMTQFVEDKL